MSKYVTADEYEKYDKFIKDEPCEDAISRKAVIDAISFGISNIRAFKEGTMIRFYEHENKALQKAIERINELPSVTPKPTECEDCVSREAVTRLFGREPFLSSNEAWYLRKINELPSVQPSRKGRWIDISNFVYECSNCGGRGMFRELFCPNCGAEMESSDADSD